MAMKGRNSRGLKDDAESCPNYMILDVILLFTLSQPGPNFNDTEQELFPSSEAVLSGFCNGASLYI